MAQNPPLDLELRPLTGEARPLEDWLTTFPLAAVVLDPYTYESSWILDTARRVLTSYSGAGVRVCWICTADVEGTRTFLGPLAEELLAFADPDRGFARGLGLGTLPAFVFLRQNGEVAAAAEGWDPEGWREVADALSDITRWPRPEIPAPGDPIAYEGTSALT